MSLANTYAKSLFDLSLEESILEEISQNYKAFIELCKENPEYYKLLTNPCMSTKEKHEILDKTVSSMNPLFLNYLYVIIDNNRVSYLEEIYEEFVHMIDEKNGILSVVVTTKDPLTEAQRNELMLQLKAKYQREIQIHNLLDPAVISGAKIKVEGTLLDDTIVHQLETLKKQLL